MADIAGLVDQLSALTVMDAANLVKQLEEKWGVSAAAPVAMVAGGGGGAAAAAPAAEAKTAFDVILASVPADKKIAVIKAVREVKAGLGLAEAKALVAHNAGEGADEYLIAHPSALIARMRAARERRDGVAAVLEKRKPSWRR